MGKPPRQFTSTLCMKPGPKGYKKLFSYSAQLSLKFILHINVKMQTIVDKMQTIVGILNIYRWINDLASETKFRIGVLRLLLYKESLLQIAIFVIAKHDHLQLLPLHSNATEHNQVLIFIISFAWVCNRA